MFPMHQLPFPSQEKLYLEAMQQHMLHSQRFVQEKQQLEHAHLVEVQQLDQQTQADRAADRKRIEKLENESRTIVRGAGFTMILAVLRRWTAIRCCRCCRFWREKMLQSRCNGMVRALRRQLDDCTAQCSSLAICVDELTQELHSGQLRQTESVSESRRLSEQLAHTVDVAEQASQLCSQEALRVAFGDSQHEAQLAAIDTKLQTLVYMGRPKHPSSVKEQQMADAIELNLSALPPMARIIELMKQLEMLQGTNPTQANEPRRARINRWQEEQVQAAAALKQVQPAAGLEQVQAVAGLMKIQEQVQQKVMMKMHQSGAPSSIWHHPSSTNLTS